MRILVFKPDALAWRHINYIWLASSLILVPIREVPEREILRIVYEGVPTGQALVVVVVIWRPRRVHHTRNSLSVWQWVVALKLFLPTPISVATLVVVPSLHDCIYRWLLLIKCERVAK